MLKFSVIVAAILLTARVNSDNSCSCNQACQNGGSLVLQDHSLSCACASPYFGSRCEQQCIIRLTSWGLKDEPLVTTIYMNDGELCTADPNGTISVNDKTIVNTYEKSWDDRVAGPTIACAALSSQNCSVIDTTKLIPLYVSTDAQKLVDFMKKQPNGSFLLCVTANEPQTNLSPFYSDIKNITGVDLKDLVYRGKFAFVVEKGNPGNGASSVTPIGGPHLYLNVGISEKNIVVKI